MSTDETDDDRDIDDEDEEDEEDEGEEEVVDEEEGAEGELFAPESLNGAVAELVDMYYLDEILVALAREIQRKGADNHGALGDAFRSDARALREAIGKLSGET